VVWILFLAIGINSDGIERHLNSAFDCSVNFSKLVHDVNLRYQHYAEQCVGLLNHSLSFLALHKPEAKLIFWTFTQRFAIIWNSVSWIYVFLFFVWVIIFVVIPLAIFLVFEYSLTIWPIFLPYLFYFLFFIFLCLLSLSSSLSEKGIVEGSFFMEQRGVGGS